ncbi:MAG TPA: 2-phospho-L-lactate guanylyltransferase [Deltaproteobacteria bacterium]|jgi:2-phospho-L-lactate guanylyltransferase|nr:2-phospho-L-lactate guanylyltransferase [Deltaproteobacteria bacterium]
MWGIIPIKSLNQAKHRLKHVLYPDERQEFFKAMFEDVLSTMMSVPDFEQVAVATVCPAACIIAKKYGAIVLSTSQDEGQTAAVERSAKILDARGITSMLVIPGDVPLVTVEEIKIVLDLHEKAPSMTIVPAQDELGSNCIALSPTIAAPLRFGPNSYFPHLETARKLGLSLQSPKLTGLGLDIDTPEDLLVLSRQTVCTRAQEYLRKKKIMERLNNE